MRLRQAAVAALCLAVQASVLSSAAPEENQPTKERIVFQTTHGDIEMALYPQACKSPAQSNAVTWSHASIS